MTESTEQTRAVQARMAQRAAADRPVARFGRGDDVPLLTRFGRKQQQVQADARRRALKVRSTRQTSD